MNRTEAILVFHDGFFFFCNQKSFKRGTLVGFGVFLLGDIKRN